MAKKWQHRNCERCSIEYKPTRDAQSYCSRECRRQAAYGRERFRAGTKGRRRRRLEASDKAPGTLVAGSFRSGDFSSIKPGCYRPTDWIEKLNQRDAYGVDQAYWTREKRNWPVDLMGGQRHIEKAHKLSIDPKLRQAILDTERVLKDDQPASSAPKGHDVTLEYYDDGYPKLPDFLDQKPSAALAKAA